MIFSGDKLKASKFLSSHRYTLLNNMNLCFIQYTKIFSRGNCLQNSYLSKKSFIRKFDPALKRFGPLFWNCFHIFKTRFCYFHQNWNDLPSFARFFSEWIPLKKKIKPIFTCWRFSSTVNFTTTHKLLNADEHSAMSYVIATITV